MGDTPTPENPPGFTKQDHDEAQRLVGRAQNSQQALKDIDGRLHIIQQKRVEARNMLDVLKAAENCDKILMASAGVQVEWSQDHRQEPQDILAEQLAVADSQVNTIQSQQKQHRDIVEECRSRLEELKANAALRAQKKKE